MDGVPSSTASPRSKIHSLLERHASHHLPPEKVLGVTSYVASLEVPQVPQVGEEEGEDQGIQMACTSESASNFSSPPLTPPDDEYITTLAKAEQQESTDEVDNSQDRLNVRSIWPPQSSTTEMAVDRQPVASSDSLHPKAGRAHSLPTSLSNASSSSSSMPMMQPKFSFPTTDRTVKSCSPHCLQVLGEQVDVLTEDSSSDAAKEGSIKAKSVLERIKEIEELNAGLLNHPSLPRPDSAGSRHDYKRASTESLSSEESILSQHSSQLSPFPPSKSEAAPAISSPDKQSSFGSNSAGLEHTSPMIITPESSPEPMRPKARIPSHSQRRNSLETQSQRPLSDCLGQSTLTSSSEDLMSPSIQYKHAVNKHTLLRAQKTKVDSTSHPDISVYEETATNKGVKELLGMFGGSLMRSKSMRELERTARPSLAGHKRTSSGHQSPVSKSFA